MGFKFISDETNIIRLGGKIFIKTENGTLKRADITRQYWKLSVNARKTIQYDLDRFRISRGEDMTYAKFLNRIFLNYANDAESSVISRIDKLKGVKKLNNKDYNMVAEVFKKYIFDKYLGCESYQCNERFHKETVKYLEECKEDLIYGEDKAGIYFQAVLEEYALLSVAKRMLIVNLDIYNEILSAYKEERRIEAEIKGYNGIEKHTFISVCEPKTNRDGSAYYVIGAELLEENGKIRFKPYSVNCSHIISIVNKSKRYAPLNEAEKNEYEAVKQWIEENEDKADYSFLQNEIKKIKVAFSENGLMMLKNIVHNRPFFYDRETSDYKGRKIYEFHCTEPQLEFYLHKFGGDAVVLSSNKELREKICEYYKNAYNTYISYDNDTDE